jgi:hypothetical protein
MIEYEKKDDSFEFEKYICFVKPELWKNEAMNLFASAKVLLEFSNLQTDDLFDKGNKLNGIFSDEIANRTFWYFRVIRMLWGYGFENILKGIIIQNLSKKDSTLTSIPIDEIKTHDLITLFNKANIDLVEEQEFYIKIIEKCSVWMGRYPLPVKAKQMYEQRKPMKTREELFERSRQLHEKFIKGEIPRTFCESDVLHGGIGTKEFEIINDLIKSTKEKFEE